MTHVIIKETAGEFAENKDVAKEIRETKLLPALAQGGKATIDFAGVNGATQSFIHALISEPIRAYGPEVLERLRFKNCNDSVRKLIVIVTEYLQESA